MSWTDHLQNLIYNVWDRKYVVVGLDCDSLGCAAIIKRVFPEAEIVALYDTEYICQLQAGPVKDFKKKYESALWLDQDVSNCFLCIGQHLITGDCTEPIPERNPHSFNPNVFFNQKFRDSFRTNSSMRPLDSASDCLQSFTKAKCPFSTTILLLHFFDEFWTRNAKLDAFLMHADSVGYNFINYEINCEAWRRLLFDSGSQINDLLVEMQSVYSKFWRPKCGSQCFCEKANDCICETCSQMCESRKSQRQRIINHLQLMKSLKQTMPNYFDALSRKTKDMQNVANPDDKKFDFVCGFLVQKEEEETQEKKSRICYRQFVHEIQEYFGGFQGLKLKGDGQEKLGPNFDQKLLLSDLNAFFQFVFSLFNDKEIKCQEFSTFIAHYVCKSPKTTIVTRWSTARNDWETRVFYKINELSLHDFLRVAGVFSFVILNAKTIRYTPTAGILNSPF